MFSVGSQEIMVILFVVLLLFGGRRIPEVARALGKGMGDFRRVVRDVQREIDLEMMKEPPAKPSPPAGKPQLPESSKGIDSSGRKAP